MIGGPVVSCEGPGEVAGVVARCGRYAKSLRKRCHREAVASSEMRPECADGGLPAERPWRSTNLFLLGHVTRSPARQDAPGGASRAVATLAEHRHVE